MSLVIMWGAEWCTGVAMATVFVGLGRQSARAVDTGPPQLLPVASGYNARK